MACTRCWGRDSGTTDMCLPCEEAVEREQLYDELHEGDEPPAFGEADADYQHEPEYVPPSGLL